MHCKGSFTPDPAPYDIALGAARFFASFTLNLPPTRTVRHGTVQDRAVLRRIRREGRFSQRYRFCSVLIALTELNRMKWTDNTKIQW